ncbi:PAS domain S-box protein [Leptolyngbya sp. FACHB-671]|uniref:sensor histidine kinase n=1 Tax=Leptolyngbya sp. FACHB-671 TaxID=2692812 RepID=UPI001687DC26|nr:PAS domain S-box protein [Leptolyngbya sp. FACHB-671]MBD2067121.1 PAS domain S-box protein [Leptolyngbya sp. FACHB-671]
MILDIDRLQALRDCCADEAAFIRLQKVLAIAQSSRSFGHRLASTDLAIVPTDLVPTDIPAHSSYHNQLRSRGSHLLQGVAEATSQLLMGDDYCEAITRALAILGKTTGVDRVHIFTIQLHPETGEPVANQKLEWVRESITAHIHDPAFQSFSFSSPSATEWYRAIAAGQIVSGVTREMPPEEQECLVAQGILAILVVPIRINSELWGFIGFDDCQSERQWSEDEKAALSMVAASIGGAIARQQVEAALRQSESRLKQIAANVPGMIYQFLCRADGSRRVLYASSGCQELLELDPEAVQADFSLIADLCHPADRVNFEQALADSAAALEPWNWEGRIITPSGKLKWIQGFSRPERQDNGDLLWDGVLVDITDRKQAEQDLRDSEARYRAMLDASPDLMFRLSRNGRYLDFKGNAMSADVPREAIVGRYLHDVLPADVADMFWREIQQTLASGELRTCEYSLPEESGLHAYEARIVVSGQDEVLTVVQDVTDRKRVEKELRDSEDRLQSFFNATFETVIIHDFNKIIDVNPATEQLLGYSAAEMIGMSVMDLVAPSYQEAVKRTWQSLTSPNQPYEYEAMGVRKDGTHFFAAVCVKAIQYKGQTMRVAGVRNITERKRTEAAIRQSEARNRALVNAIPDLMFRISRDGTYLDCKAERDGDVLLPPSQLIGKTVYEVLPPDLAEQRMHYVEQALKTGEIQLFEYQLRLSNNRANQLYRQMTSEQIAPSEIFYIRDYEARVVVSGEDEVLAIVRDITERKCSEHQLRASAERDRLLGEIALRIRQSLDLNEILNTAAVEVRHLLKADRVSISHYNEAGISIVVAESVAENVLPTLGSVTDSSIYEEVRDIFERDRIYILNDTEQAKSPPYLKEYYKQYQIRAGIAVPIMPDGRFFGSLVVNQCSNPREWQPFEADLMDRLATQVTIAIQQSQLYQQVQSLNAGLEQQVEERTAQLQQKMQELQQLNQLKDEFLNAFSHDLRTPIMGVSLVLKNLLNQSGEIIPITRSIVTRMLQSSEHQLQLINSLLQAHAGETQGVVLHCELLQLGLLTQVILEELEPLVLKNQATLKNLVPPDLPLVTADPLQLRRVFENLITNALNHNPPGVDLTVSATVEEEMIRFNFQDNGVGMSQEVSDRLFERYVRGPKSRHSTGIGLGLYLSRQIITAHGGQIGVHSAPNVGSTFWLTLPLAISSAAQSNLQEG